MTPAELSRTVLGALRHAVREGAVAEVSEGVAERVTVAVPRPGGYGDYACNVALLAAGPARTSPLALAALLRERLRHDPRLAEVRVTGPGFLNFRLAGPASYERDVVAEAGRPGDALAGQRLVLRPDGARAHVLAEALVRLVRAQGGEARLDATGGEPLRAAPPYEATAPLDPDTRRWALLHTAPAERPRLDAGLLVQRVENPLFLVRYAHARARALVRNAADLGYGPEPGDSGPEAAPLLALLAEHPAVLLRAAEHRAPDRLARRLVRLADALLGFHDRTGGLLPLGGLKPLAAHRARLALAEAAGTVLAGGLTLLGISAPQYV
ncbi:ArgS-related anticodon-binding protein NrtL [Streptomyces sp. SPB074]|uniref:ArgS-related anticodon-binding protein NrtL n=1 Tax=Streptomyces sp. (strain SPB074) TaxID=465543 RepID=UPI0001D1E321|nr:DALR anticodon-binding domain-containing protein [Streptomyces sp. SPB074]EFG64651.1 arginine-tRNA ligase [Streptomyces sp. SPB074]